MHPLTGVRIRISEADKALESLKESIRIIGQQHANSVVAEFDAKSGELVCRVKRGTGPDATWGVRIGEIAHNLRAALDGIAWQVALLNTPDPDFRTQFPIFWLRKTKRKSTKSGIRLSAFVGAGTGNHLKSIAKKHWAFFERHQPYKRGNGHRRDPLWLLKEINDTDKHRLLHLTIFALRSYAIIPTEVTPGAGVTINELEFGTIGKPIKDGAVLCRVRGPGVTRKGSVNVKFNITVEVRFDQTCSAAKNLPVFPTLTSIRDRVRGIVDSFAPLFPALHDMPPSTLRG